MKRKICVISGSRAEYGLLKALLEGIRSSADLDLQLVVTGMHLSPEFGLTAREIEQDGFSLADRIEILLSSDSPVGVAKAMGLGMIGFADALARLAPDIVVVLGDRFEILAAGAAALVAGIPIAHIHGGETTEGAFDEAIRHSLTKMAHLHFVAAPPYRDRVVQLGEHPDRVFLVGGLGIDAIRRVRRMSRTELEESIGFRFGRSNLLVTYHSPTLETGNPVTQLDELLAALATLGPETHLLFTLPNADTGGRALIERINQFAVGRANVCAVPSLGQHRYLSALSVVDGVVGNSSSGLAEAPSFGVGTINIGDRQAGRLKAESVIDCLPTKEGIEGALKQLFSEHFRASLVHVHNPYGDGGATDRILNVLRTHPLQGLLKKSFFDLPVPPAALGPLNG
ncbi:MAG: UDP-N-acetylglucosamine 2-epimerase (hydrolyzing) [Sphingosinicella sp.]|nr:UDP-N-acetylglucosamine 2-epimerase (hydrolyzing) [Sphingosinicella sp.]